MSLPASWVNHIFAKLTVRYGDAFMRLYRDLDPELVKADWAEVLAGFDNRHGYAFDHAMQHLPQDPPTALKFRELCRRAPEENRFLLAPPVPKAGPGMAKAAHEAITKAQRDTGGKSLAQQCIDSIDQIGKDRGGVMSSAQKHMRAHCMQKIHGHFGSAT